MYASDITRTVPVNGHFTARQREIYNIVLGAQQAAIDAFVAVNPPSTTATARIPTRSTTPRTTTSKPTAKIARRAARQVLAPWPGHMIGIDVHDPAQYPAVLKPGMVFTIEPHLYSRGKTRRAHRVRLPGGR